MTSNSAYPPNSEGMRVGGGSGGQKGRRRRRSWDWACDGCDRNVSHELILDRTFLGHLETD